MPVPFLNQTTGQLEFYQESDLTPEALPLLAARGLRQATPEDIANRERTLEYSSVGQQALAQAERVVRGATLGQVEGFGSDEEVRARAEVSEDVSPVMSLAADFAPDIALGVITGGTSALATTAGRAAARGAGRAALSAAAKAAPKAALAGEALAGGAVTASQQAFQEGRQFFREDPVEDATNTLLWSGIGGLLGGAHMAFRAVREAGGSKVAKEAAEALDEADLAAARAAGESDAVPLAAEAGESTPGVPLTSDEGTQAAYATEQGLEARPLSPRAQEILDRHRRKMAEAGHVSVGTIAEPVHVKRWMSVGKKAKENVDPELADALRVYTESGHQGANNYLRGVSTRKTANDEYFKDISDKVTRYLDSQIQSGNTVPGTVYRGVRKDAFPETLTPGQEWSDPGFLSTTRDLTAAQNFGGDIVLEVEQATGVPLFRKNWRNINREQEVLLRPGTKFEVVSDTVKKAPNGQDRRFVKLREKGPATKPEPAHAKKVDTSDLRLPDDDGYLEKVDPDDSRIPLIEGEIAEFSENGLVGKSLDDLKALPIEGEESLKKIESFKKDKSFRESGMLPSNNDRSRGGLPHFQVFEGEPPYLINGRHRFTAAKESGQEFIIANVKRYDANGDAIWDWVGPVRINAPAGAASPAEKAIQDRLAKLKPGSLEHKQLSKTLEKVRSRASQAGMASLGDTTQVARGVASSPLGNVVGAGAGAVAGGQLTGEQGGVLGGGALGLAGSLLLGRRGGKLARAAERGVAKAERNAVRSHADDIVRKVTKGEEPLGKVDGFLRDSRLAQYHPEIIDVATKEMRNDLNELNRLSQGIRERAVKHEDVAKNISDNLPAQQAKARDVALAGQRLAGEMRIEAQQLGQQLGKKGPAYFSGTARDLVSSLIERTEAISHMTDGAEIFNALDDLKRIVDNHKVALESGARKSTKDPIRYQELVPRVEEFANKIRSSLEDTATFGRAGEMQKAYNATYHKKWFPAKQVFEDSVFRRTGRDYKAFDTLDAWESKVTGLLENAGTGERRHVNDMLGALREMAEQRAKFGTASKAETDRIVSLVNKIERTFKLADDAGAAKGRLEMLTPVAQAAGGAVGAGVGGLAGAILGGSVARGVTELATGKYRRAFMAMRGATEETVERSVDDWIQVSKGRAGVKGAKRTKPRVELGPEARHLMRTAQRMGVTYGFAEFLGDNDDPQSAFATKRDALFDDQGFVERFAEEYGDLATEEPQVYAVAAGKAGEVRRFLLDRLPSSVAVSMARPNGYPPTNEAIEDWSVYWNAATNPRSVVQSMSRGDIRPQEVETLRTLYRPLYEKLQATLIDKISNATNMGDDLDDQFVMRMSLLFDLDGAGTPAFSQRAANVSRQVAPAQPPQQSKPFAPKVGTRVSPSNVAINGPTYGSGMG